MKKLFMIPAIAILIAAGVTDSHAVPSLGVGSSFGYVNAEDAYQTYWGSSILGPSGEDGFVVGPSGSSLHVFTNISGADIYILTTADVGVGNSITFNGSVNTYDVGVFRSYKPVPYYGIDLGIVNSSWSTLPKNPFTPDPFYALDVSVAYTGALGTDQWIFAAADTNGLAELQAEATTIWVDDNGLADIQTRGLRVRIDGNWVTFDADTFTDYHRDDSSPKTTSARGWQVPEAGALLLFGTGLLGLVGYRRARRMQ